MYSTHGKIRQVRYLTAGRQSKPNHFIFGNDIVP